MRRMPVARFIGSGLYSWRVDPSVPSDGNGVPSGYLIGNNAQSVGDHPAHELRREDRSSVHSTNWSAPAATHPSPRSMTRSVGLVARVGARLISRVDRVQISHLPSLAF
jgi:hypothetical protein